MGQSTERSEGSTVHNDSSVMQMEESGMESDASLSMETSSRADDE